ncbi:vacuolar-sorting receptor 6-like, partial [Triticum urartu]|uniref:vacuolar-sorting receptor 6-like n=1 Tax=Triticum urartu TaxID=4572 RepID=UPI002043A56E
RGAANSGGCWKETRHGKTFSACKGSGSLSGCECSPGFKGDGLTCEDVDECSEKVACTCPGCSCKNNWGGYHCSCGGGGNQVYIQAEDTCVGKSAAAMGWMVTALVLSCLAGAGLAGFAFYKYRLRRYMDSEVAAIMSQYMPLESQSSSGENRPLREEAVEAA